jgi:predicted nucleic acid-binding protein
MFLDTTVIVDILRGEQKVIDYIEKISKNEPLFFSLISIGELADWARSNNLNTRKVISDVKSIASMMSISDEICIDGSKLKKKQRDAGKKKFSLIDGLIAASAMRSDQKLLTRDSDFEGLKNVNLI